KRTISSNNHEKPTSQQKQTTNKNNQLPKKTKNKKTVENQVPTIHHDQPHASSRSMNPASNTQPTTTNSQNKPINHNKQTWHTIEFSNNTFHNNKSL
ncbi:hypothetical protein, partial [Corynebacterium freiburgense]|uniref:hypothetical protein n=1 Tax=Corynebacterium freiburgense TaxID=556548 RepID=UPI001969C811